jgi:hypothetical protein
MNLKTKVENKLKNLLGLRLDEFGRAADLLWIQFGTLKKYTIKFPKRTTQNIGGDWAIHVQCAWRLTHKGIIILSWRDFHFNPDGQTNYDWDNDNKKSRFDMLVKKINREIKVKKLKVADILNVDDVGGFSLKIENDYTFDVFPDNSIRDDYTESWRIFKPRLDKKHFIVD